MKALMSMVLVLLLAAPARADEEDDDLAPIAPVKPSTQPKRPKKKPAPAATPTPAPRETVAPLELTDTPAAEPKKVEPAPVVKQADPAPPTAAPTVFEDPDLAAASQVRRKAGSPLTTVGWVAAGVGAALLVTGAVVGGLAANARSGLALDSRGVVVGGAVERAGAAVQLSRMATGLLVFGGAAAVGGVLLALWPSTGSASALRVVPSAGPDTASVLLEGVWP
jgi:hypothetical protein